MNYLLELLRKKEKKVTGSLDIEKIEALKDLFQNPNCFFDVNMEVAVDILSFLEVPENDILNLYYKLISPENFQTIPKIRITESKTK